MQNRYRRSLLALCCVVLAGELACNDSTAPDTALGAGVVDGSNGDRGVKAWAFARS